MENEWSRDPRKAGVGVVDELCDASLDVPVGPHVGDRGCGRTKPGQEKR